MCYYAKFEINGEIGRKSASMDAGGLAFGTATTLAFFQIIGILP